MQPIKINLTTIARTGSNSTNTAPGNEHHTSIDVAGAGSRDFPFPSHDELVKKALRRAAREARNQRKRDRKAGKVSTVTDTNLPKPETTNEGTGLIGSLKIPTAASVLPAGETRESYTTGQTILHGADGFQTLMMSRQYDGFYEERFGDLGALFAYGKTPGNMPVKVQRVCESLDTQLDKLRASYSNALPKLVAELAKKNPKAPIMAVMQKAVQLIDKELMRILYVLNIYGESVKQARDNRFPLQFGAISIFFEDVFNLYVSGDLEGTIDGSAVRQLPTSTYSVGDVFMPRVTSSGLATLPGANGPIGANALQFPFEMLDILMLVLPLLGHEARHNVYHDIKGLEEESLEVVEAAIRAAHAAGTIKLANEEMEVNGEKIKTIDMVVKLWCEWLGEVDADVVGGVLFSGDAFGDNMVMSFPAMMVRSGKVSSKENLLRTESRYNLVPQKDGSVALVFEEHPIDFVRVKLVAATLDEIGSKAGDRLRKLADFMVGDTLPTEVTYKDAEGENPLVITFNTADLIAVAPVVAKALIRTPMKALLGKSNGDLVMWNDKRQAKVDALAAVLVKGQSDLPTDIGSIFATYVGAAAPSAYLKLVESGVAPEVAAESVNTAALKMSAGLRALAASQSAARKAATTVVVADTAVAVVVVDNTVASSAPVAGK